MDASPPRPAALLLVGLVAVCLALPDAASASQATKRREVGAHAKSHPGQARTLLRRGAAKRRHRRAGRRAAVAAARISRRGGRRAAASHRRRAARDLHGNPETLFRSDFEEGFGSWHVQSLGDRATLSSDGAFRGSRAARFEVREGDVEPETGSSRSEVSGPTFDEGQDLYIRDAIRVPSSNTFSGPWQIVQQLHEEDWDGSPGMAVFLDAEPTLRIGAGDGSTTFWQSAKLQRNRWFDLVYRVRLSQNPGVGFVEVWLDGVRQTLVSGQTRVYGQTIQAAETYLKAGIYRSKSSSGTSVVEHDEIVVGTSLGAVTGG